MCNFLRIKKKRNCRITARFAVKMSSNFIQPEEDGFASKEINHCYSLVVIGMQDYYVK